jgi:hypothetical protein
MGTRYTPPKSRNANANPPWMIAFMVATLVMGLVVIVANFTGVLPGGQMTRYLAVGFVLFLLGFATTTQLK